MNLPFTLGDLRKDQPISWFEQHFNEVEWLLYTLWGRWAEKARSGAPDREAVGEIAMLIGHANLSLGAKGRPPGLIAKGDQAAAVIRDLFDQGWLTELKAGLIEDFSDAETPLRQDELLLTIFAVAHNVAWFAARATV